MCWEVSWRCWNHPQQQWLYPPRCGQQCRVSGAGQTGVADSGPDSETTPGQPAGTSWCVQIISTSPEEWRQNHQHFITSYKNKATTQLCVCCFQGKNQNDQLHDILRYIKAGLEALSECIYLEAKEDDIHVIIIDPGDNLFSKTNLGAKQLDNYKVMENNCLSLPKKGKFEKTKTIFGHIKSPDLLVIQDSSISWWVNLNWTEQ